MRVLKFGGSSVGTPTRIENVMDIVAQSRAHDRYMVVVFSAFQGITDQLISMSHIAAAGNPQYSKPLRGLKRRHLDAAAKLIARRRKAKAEAFLRLRLSDLTDVLHGVFFTKELTPRTLDYIMSFGEILSSFIIAEAFNGRGIRCTFTDSRLLITTDDTFGAAHVNYSKTNRTIREYFKKRRGMHVVPGFIASTADNITTTLGRGGSDFTASIYGAALHADEIEIWTDVDGVMTADPRKVEKAFSIPRMTYEEAMEMSHFGAKVIHPPTMQPALDLRLPIRIKNTFHAEFPGTVIGSRDDSSAFVIKGISSIDEIALLRIQGSGMIGVSGTAMRVFGALARKNINIILTTQASSEYSICLAVLPQFATIAKQLLEEEFRHEIRDHTIDEVLIESNLSVVAIVGENMRKTTGISARLFKALGENGINVVAIAQGSSELNISTVVKRSDEAKALNALHDAFFLSGTKSLNLFIVGTGVVGGTLLRQIELQRDTLLRERNLDIRIHAVAGSRRMLFAEPPTALSHSKEGLEKSKTPMNIKTFVHRMKEMNLPNSVFVDCTSSDAVVEAYEEVLSSSISIVTPNKKANAGPYEFYQRLRHTALKHNARFLYETNVGAGLPIINPINDLVAGGDRILKIEGVFSGTLSYIFNSFKEGTRFSDIVREAKSKGYTEPDPHDDLNGMDVGRKLLILPREAGHRLEFRNVRIQSLIPASLTHCTLQDFFRRLPSLDRHFERVRLKAHAQGKVLRYIALWEGTSAHVSLQAVPSDHPASELTGSDITIVLTTVNCREHPVVIKGPGAGAEVTATAVLADIIRIGHYLD